MVLYHSYTIWLFTFSSVKDTVVPCSVFGLFAALSGPALDLPQQDPFSILSRAPLVLFYVWLNILLFCLHNQRHPCSIAEDSINKPWRPLPSSRLSSADATRLMIATYPITLFMSWRMGAFTPAAVLTCLDLWYNDFGGADSNGILRNALNACGYACLLSGAMKVAIGPVLDGMVSVRAWSWVGIIACVIFTTIHVQDFRDAPGDALRNRRTLLSVIGDRKARWTVAAGVTVWSLLGPLAWHSPWEGYLGPIAVGYLVVRRLLERRDVEADRLTYKIWCFWFVTFFPLPWLVWLKSFGLA
jgi:4-hydroxybenzoate polyprenyltransferase